MLKCDCGWIGVNLKPNYENNKALCPKCGSIFQGIPAKDAIYTSEIEEVKLQKKYEDDMLLFSEIVKLKDAL